MPTTVTVTNPDGSKEQKPIVWVDCEERLFDPGPQKPLLIFHADGRVELGKDLNLDDVKRLEMPYLKALREIINTAIYDKERGI